MGRLLHFLTHGAPLCAQELRYDLPIHRPDALPTELHTGMKLQSLTEKELEELKRNGRK